MEITLKQPLTAKKLMKKYEKIKNNKKPMV